MAGPRPSVKKEATSTFASGPLAADRKREERKSEQLDSRQAAVQAARAR